VEVFTSRYFAQNLLTSGVVVPVRISQRPPIIPLPYELAGVARTLTPDWKTTGQNWDVYCPTYWTKLERVGVEGIARELAEISKENDDKALALLCYEDLLRGHRCHRVIFSLFWEQHTGERIPELTDEGELIALEQFHRQTAPILDAGREEVPRWMR